MSDATDPAQATVDGAPPAITIRAPVTAGSTSSTTTYSPPPIPWLAGTWHVTHSTLGMWKKARNVTISYKPLPSSTPDESVPLDDLVAYQGLTSDKIKTISGLDKPAGDGAWTWRGHGWLIFISSHWQVLGHGEEEGEQWAVTYFSKTLFTNAGLDIYSRAKEGLSEKTLSKVREALKNVDAEDVKVMESNLFEVRRN